jgi:cobalamin biosynthesis protein CbiD
MARSSQKNGQNLDTSNNVAILAEVSMKSRSNLLFQANQRIARVFLSMDLSMAKN